MFSIALAVKGERPKNSGHYIYYSDPEIPFNKVILTTEFDPYGSPEDGFGLLIEYKKPNDQQHSGIKIQDIVSNLIKVGIVKNARDVIAEYVWEVDPAYVLFTDETQRITADCFEFLYKYGITSLGRYGHWEYSSMAENIRDGINYAKSLKQ